MRPAALVFILLASHVASACLTGSQGNVTHRSKTFTLVLDKATQIATRLAAHTDAGPFDFLLSPQNRSSDGFLSLGDLQIRFRSEAQAVWQDLGTHVTRSHVHHLGGHSKVASADIGQSLGPRLPFAVTRSWSVEDESVTLSFNVTNKSPSAIEFGGLGIPTPGNNDWQDQDDESTWTKHVVTDPAPSLDAGYTITNRLTGAFPTLLTIPVGSTPLEAYRLNYANTSNATWPASLRDHQRITSEYEGVFSWWSATSGIAEIDAADARTYGFDRGRPWNAPSSIVLQPGISHSFGLRFVLAHGPRGVEERLHQLARPNIVGVPGFVVARGEPFRLMVRHTSAVQVINIAPPALVLDEPILIGEKWWSINGRALQEGFGEVRVTLHLGSGEVATAHYTIIRPHAEQLDALGAFRFKHQYFNTTHDYFDRSPSVISFDHSTMQQVVDDSRAWVAGLSDEGGSGAYVSAAAKQLCRPDEEQIGKLEAFATQTLWGGLQNAVHGSDEYGAVRKSLFYYDSAVDGEYDQLVNHTETWSKDSAESIDRGYNYPHPVVVYWTLYRLARNHVSLVKLHHGKWYLDRCVDTIAALEKHAGLGYDASCGLMEGTYFLRVLEDLKREGFDQQAGKVERFMKARADSWSTQVYPYVSEFSWDNTAQEEVYAWSRYFGHEKIADKTVETLMAVMSSVPHWGYSGAGRDLWDCRYSCKMGPGARRERILHHYKGSQSSLVLMDHFMLHPHDIKMLRAGYGGVIGPLASILEDGFGSSAYHSRQDYLNWDPLSGDNGVNMALYALNARAIYVNATELGGPTGFGATVTAHDGRVVVIPTDGMQQRLFLAPIALYVELDSGKLHTCYYDSHNHSVTLVLRAADQYTKHARIRLRTTARTAASGIYVVEGSTRMERGAFVVELQDGFHTVPLKRWSHQQSATNLSYPSQASDWAASE